MTRVVLAAVVALLTVTGPVALQTQQSTAGQGRIAGRVVAAQTGRPIPGAVVRLVSFEVMRVGQSAVTDAEGRYVFTGLAAGRYQLAANADRYLTLQYGQRRPADPARPIDLGEGEAFDEAHFALPRASAIEGVVLDEFGDPAPNVLVQVSRLEFVAGRRRLVPITSAASRLTDDKGRYRVFGLGPGQYYLTALAGAFAGPRAPGGFAPTYYPGTADPGAAHAVRVPLGGDVTELSFALIPATTARVSGTMVDAAGRPVARGAVLLATSDRAGVTSFVVAQGTTSADGRFSFSHIPAGTYVVQGFGPTVGAGGGLGGAQFGWLPVTVPGDDLEDLSLRVSPGVAARGPIVLERDEVTPAPKPEDVRVRTQTVEFDAAPLVGGGGPPSVTREDWTCEVTNLSGRRVIRVEVRASGWSLKRITLDGQDVTDRPLDFRVRGVDDLEVVLTSRGASVEGRVVDASGTPVATYAVVVFAADSARWTFPSRFIALGRPNQYGRFIVRGLPPAPYLAVAVPAIEGNEWQDPEWLDAYRPFAVPVALSEGEVRTLDLRLTIKPEDEERLDRTAAGASFARENG